MVGNSKKEVNEKNKKFFVAVSILVGTCVGAGILGLPYVASKTGFSITFLYLLGLGGIVLLVNLYLSEIILRTKEKHQLIGYAEKYLGRKGRHFMEFAVVFGIYSAMVAYTLGIGESLSFLFFGDITHSILFGVIFGFFMLFLLKGGIKSLKRFEKWGVLIVLSLFFFIVLTFSPNINYENLLELNFGYFLIPFGVVLFSMMSFHSIPEMRFVVNDDGKLFKKAVLSGTLISILIYILFSLVIVGTFGQNTPEVATLALGPVFIFLGIFTMFTSYFAMGNSLMDNFKFDERYTERSSWILASIIPIIIFLITQLSKFFSFTKILSIGGVISGGSIAVLVLLMIKKAKRYGDRKPEYSVHSRWFWIILFILIFIFGVVSELFLI
jgi:tyrosine-specific transport protein